MTPSSTSSPAPPLQTFQEPPPQLYQEPPPALEQETPNLQLAPPPPAPESPALKVAQLPMFQPPPSTDRFSALGKYAF